MAHLVRFPVAAIGAAGSVVVDSCEKTNATEVTGSQPYKNLKATNEAYQTSMGKKQGSLDTDAVAEADKRRDRAVVGIREYVHSKTYWPEPGIAAAANRLEPFILQYAANIENEPYNNESTLIHTFLAKLAEREWEQDRTTLDMQPLIDHLIQAQQIFEDTQSNRSLTSAAKSEIAAASNKRRDLERAIRAFMEYAKAMELTTANPVWHQLNIAIKQRLAEIELGHRTATKQTQSEVDKD